MLLQQIGYMDYVFQISCIGIAVLDWCIGLGAPVKLRECCNRLAICVNTCMHITHVAHATD